jgi:hypothetical protein
MGLTYKKRAFIEHYLQVWQGDRAAIAAGYSAKSARSKASALLKTPEVQDAIRLRLDELKMGADEVLARLTEQGRANLGDFFDASGQPDWPYIKSHGHLLKSLSETRQGYRLELYDAQNALVQMGKASGLFAEKHEFNAAVALKLYTNVNPDDWDQSDDERLPG